MLRDFVIDSDLCGGNDASTVGNGKPRRRGRGASAGVKTEGVLVTYQSGPDESLNSVDPLRSEVSEEEDEPIW